jgi:hypothetical protein
MSESGSPVITGEAAHLTLFRLGTGGSGRLMLQRRSFCRCTKLTGLGYRTSSLCPIMLTYLLYRRIFFNRILLNRFFFEELAGCKCKQKEY